VGSKPELKGFIDHLDRTLAKPENSGANRAFDEYQRKRGRPAPWYYDVTAPASSRIASLGSLAKTVGCKGEYETIYRHSSYYVHGAFTGTSLKHDEKGVAIELIRTPEGWREL